jgi:hypothetical protein
VVESVGFITWVGGQFKAIVSVVINTQVVFCWAGG